MSRDAKQQQESREPHKRAPGLEEMDTLARNPTGAGITFGLSVVLFTLGGYALDHWLETLPLFLLIGLAIGAIGGFIHLVESVSPGTLFPSRRPAARRPEVEGKYEGKDEGKDERE